MSEVTTPTPVKPGQGQLKRTSIGIQYGAGLLPYDHYTCDDCGTSFPYFTLEQAVELRKPFGAGIYCNGVNIISCPYCTPKGQKYTNPNVKLTVMDEAFVEPFVRPAIRTMQQAMEHHRKMVEQAKPPVPPLRERIKLAWRAILNIFYWRQ